MGTLDPQPAVFIYAEMLLNMGTLDSQSVGGGIFQVFGQIRSVLGGSDLNHTLHWKKGRLGQTKPRLLSRAPFLVSFSRTFSPSIFRMSVPDASFRCPFLRPAIRQEGGRGHRPVQYYRASSKYYRRRIELSRPWTRTGRNYVLRKNILSALDGNITGPGESGTEFDYQTGNAIDLGRKYHRP